MSTQNSFNTGQLRGAYAAGFEAGAKEGAATMRREGWKRAKDCSEIQVGAVVKTLTPTMAGWIGYGTVLEVTESGVLIAKANAYTDEGDPRTADLGIHDVAYRVVEDLAD